MECEDEAKYLETISRDKRIPFYDDHNSMLAGYTISHTVFVKLKETGFAGIKGAAFDILQYAACQRELADEYFEIGLGTEVIWICGYARAAKRLSGKL